MAVSPIRPALCVVTLAIAGAVLSACGLGGGPGGAGGGSTAGGKPSEDAAALARATVQDYLDAMESKEPTAGRSKLCAPLHASFDQSATGPNGDFAGHFTVTSAEITEVTADGGRQRVNTVVQATAGKQTFTRGIMFVVTPVDGTWCISDEAPGETSAPDPDGPPSEASSPSL